MNSKTLAGLGLLGGGAYLAYEYYKHNGIKEMAELDAHSQWELMGYINGLIRGAGNTANAIQKLEEWTTYWINQVTPEEGAVVMEWYDYGNKRIIDLGTKYGDNW